MTLVPFDIVENAHGGKTCSNGAQSLLTVEPDTRVFRRRATTVSGPSAEWIVAQLDNVRVYFDGQTVTVTRQDIYP